jgi:hypothetical protein
LAVRFIQSPLPPSFHHITIAINTSSRWVPTYTSKHPTNTSPGGLQTTSAAVGDVLGNSYDMRGGQSKKSDEAGKAIGELGKGEI